MIFKEIARAARDGFLGSIYLFVSIIGAVVGAVRSFVNHEDGLSKRRKHGSGSH